MAYERYCYHCARQVQCREEPTESATRLFCPHCDHRIGVIYGHIVIT